MIRLVGRLLDCLDDILYPSKALCLCCRRISHGSLLCPQCRQDLDACRLSGDLCPLCGHVLKHSPCAFCRSRVPGRFVSVWRHTGTARSLVHLLKYRNVADAADVLAPAMASQARLLSLPSGTVVTWVAMPSRRRRERGIDHGRLLAQAVARELGLPCRQLLVRQHSGRTQRGLSRRARQRNLTGMFSCPDKLTCPVLLVDDVMTTSATVRVCMDALKAAGAAQVYAVTATQA